jgi:hypothetical protein
VLAGALGCDADPDSSGREELRGACNLDDEDCAQRPEALLVWQLFDEADIDVDDEDVVLLDEETCEDDSSGIAMCGNALTAGPRATEQHFRCTASVCCYWGAIEVGSSTGYWGCIPN